MISGVVGDIDSEMWAAGGYLTGCQTSHEYQLSDTKGKLLTDCLIP